MKTNEVKHLTFFIEIVIVSGNQSSLYCLMLTLKQNCTRGFKKHRKGTLEVNRNQ